MDSAELAANEGRVDWGAVGTGGSERESFSSLSLSSLSESGFSEDLLSVLGGAGCAEYSPGWPTGGGDPQPSLNVDA